MRAHHLASPPRARATTALLAALSLVMGLAVAMPPAARADATGFQLNGQSFGANATVMIELGTLTRDCDFIETASTVYVVPTGTVGPGSSLADVSGTPNVLTSFLGGSAIFDEIVAITAPGGTVGEGTYDIVEDTCQNGVFDGSDSILANAFTVEFPSGVPPLPSPAIAAMKAGAIEQRTYWTQAAQAYTALFAAYTAYTLISDALDPQGFYLTYVCAFLPSNPNPDIPITPYCPTVGIDLVIKLQLEVVKTIVNKAAHYNGIAADPPDPDFVAPSLPAPAPAFSTPTGDPVEVALAEWADVVGQDEVLADAFLGALEKYQGAEAADDPAAALMHARAIQTYAVALQERQVRQSERLDAALDAMAAAGFNPDAELAALRADQARIAADGFDNDEVRGLRNLGLDAAAIAHLRQSVVDDIDLENPLGSTVGLFNGQVQANNSMGEAFIDLANAMTPVITSLETVVATSGVPAYPVVDAGGPYTGSGGSVTLTATCDACASVAWDLDGDGAFDDATGSSASVTPGPGSHLVGVRGTGATGLQAADHAVVTVTTSNRPPRHSAEEPATGTPVDAPVGETTAFSVTASDPDGDAVTTEWFSGVTSVGTGTSHAYTALADKPTALLRAVSTDPAGARASSTWFVRAVHADADADGWTANVDCADGNPAVNPGATEVGGNGVDDDCNPATPDAGVPAASFTHSPVPGILGEEVTFTDTSTDPEGEIATRAWDVDDDGTPDGTGSTLAHTFATAGTFRVSLRVTDADGLEATATKDVVVTDRPVADFSWSPADPEPGESVAFTSTSTDADGIATLEWDFSYDGATFNVDSTEAGPSRALTTGTLVALRVTDTLGAVSTIASKQVAVSGPPAAAFNPRPANGGTNVALAPHGASVSGFSTQNTTYTAAELLDVDYPSALVGWRTATGAPSNQWVTLDLGRSYLVDRLRVQPTSSTTARPAQVTLALAQAGSAPGDFTTAVSTELANSSTLQEFNLTTPVQARYLRFDALTNRGATYTGTDRLEAWTGQVGTAEVVFTDRSTDPDGAADLVTWQWDFGHDGQTSTDRNPTHTFPGPGEYTVKLTVTDAAGATSTATLVQTVVGPTVTPSFTLPTNPREGASAAFTDTTTPIGRAIVNRVWSWGDGSESLHSTTGSRTYADNGGYDITLTLTDTYGLVTSATRRVDVANVPPTVNAGPDQTVYVGEPSVFTALAASDAGVADRPTLHCRIDYGDGTVVDIPGCTATLLRAPHTYASAGVHTVTLTVTDKDGGTASDTATHRVAKRSSYLSAQVVPGSARGGFVDVRAVLWDESWQVLPGETVTLDVDGTSVTSVTDAEGTVAARMAFAGPSGNLTASLAESHRRLGASDSDPIATTQRPPGDVFFIVDESGSMGTYQAQMRANIVAMAQQLSQTLDPQIGVAGLPGTALFMKVPPTDNLEETIAGANALNTSNGGEYGIDGVALAARPGVGWRPSAGKCLVLIGDEPAQRRSFTVDQARQALSDNDVVLFSIITIDATTLDYQNLATGSGGAFFDINAFRTDPQPVLQALTSSCAAAITERPDLNVTVDDGRDTVEQGSVVEYTVTVGNTGLVDASGVAAKATLPGGLAFVSASDGGTAAGGVISWPAFGLGPGATEVRTFTARVDADAATSLTVTATVSDDGTRGDDVTPANNTASDTDTVEAAANAAPEASAAGPYQGVEGSPVPIAGTASDADGDALVLDWSVAPGTGVDPGGSCALGDPAASSTTVTCTDDGEYVATLSVSDGQHEPVTSTAILTITNAPPGVTITGPADQTVVSVDAGTTFTADYSDTGSNDSHAYRVDFGDGTPAETGAASGGRVGLDHAFAATGTYEVTVHVTDDDGATGSDTITVVVAGPASKVTGGGFVVQNGRTSFGFVAQADGSGWKGQLSLKTPDKDHFKGTTVDTLTVVGKQATWTGAGRWNGEDGYTFAVIVVDNGSGGGRPRARDTFRIRVAAADGSTVFEAVGELRGGNVTVH